MKYTVWTDGACSCNPGSGGLAYIIVSHDENDKQYTFSEGYVMTTNNRMEMLSIIKVLEFLEDKNPTKIVIKSDSQYSINTFNTWIWRWENKNFEGKKNIDLLQRAIILLKKFRDILTIEWVKGHSGNTMNDACDLLAKQQYRNSINLQIDENYIKSCI